MNYAWDDSFRSVASKIVFPWLGEKKWIAASSHNCAQSQLPDYLFHHNWLLIDNYNVLYRGQMFEIFESDWFSFGHGWGETRKRTGHVSRSYAPTFVRTSSTIVMANEQVIADKSRCSHLHLRVKWLLEANEAEIAWHSIVLWALLYDGRMCQLSL